MSMLRDFATGAGELLNDALAAVDDFIRAALGFNSRPAEKPKRQKQSGGSSPSGSGGRPARSRTSGYRSPARSSAPYGRARVSEYDPGRPPEYDEDPMPGEYEYDPGTGGPSYDEDPVGADLGTGADLGGMGGEL